MRLRRREANCEKVYALLAQGAKCRCHLEKKLTTKSALSKRNVLAYYLQTCGE